MSFDLDARIRAWRQSLAPRLGDRLEVLDELESHLREEVQRLSFAGQPPEAAWQAALARLGPPEQLADEFAKLPARPLRWLPGLVVIALYSLTTVVSMYSFLARWRDGDVSGLLVAHVATVLTGYLATFAFGALAVWAILQRLWVGWTPRRAECLRWWGLRFSLAAVVLCTVGVVLGAAWGRDNLGAYWTNDPREFGGVALIAWNAVALGILSRRHRSVRTDLVLGLGGNIAVSLGWFLAAALARSSTEHGYGPVPLKILLTTFLLTHALLLILALLPPRVGGKMGPERAP